MAKIVYNKLVRDRIPEIIEGDGMPVVTRVLGEDEYRTQLRQKLDEEIREFDESGDVEELADIVEIILALAVLRGVSAADFERLRGHKHAERGGFDRRLLLIEAG